LSSEYDFKTVIQYLSAMALVLFFLMYMPWTLLSAYATTMGPVLLWAYYFTLVLGLLFPLFYATGEENLAWYCLGFSILVNSVIWLIVEPVRLAPALITLVLGVLFFIGPIFETRMKNWELWKNVLHILKGLMIVAATALYANLVPNNFIGVTSYNHVMPQFLFLGGGLTVVFGFILFVYGLFKILSPRLPGKIGEFFGILVKVFYVLMVLVFLLGITYNVGSYVPFAAIANPWSAPGFPTSIEFFGFMYALGLSNLGAILLLILYLYGMGRIVEKQHEHANK